MPDQGALVAAIVHRLRSAGVAVGTNQALTFAEAVRAVPPVTAADLYWAGRATLVCHHADLPAYEEAFLSWLLPDRTDDGSVEGGDAAHDAVPPDAQAPSAHPRDCERAGRDSDASAAERPAAPGSPPGTSEERSAAGHAPHAARGDLQEVEDVVGGIASGVEALRTRRFDEATDAELRAIRELMANIVVTVPHRRSRRTRRVSRGRVPDLRRSVRSAIQTDGELLRRAWRGRRVEPRRLVLVLDVSGSMAGYSRALLQFAFSSARVVRGDVEVFCFGTRLTRLTEELGGADVDAALTAAAARVLDWNGGTLIGQSLATLNATYGRRGLLRGAVVVVCSDGLDRGDPDEVRRQMARVARYAHRVVWVNPLKGDDRYEPLARSMAAALPHLDRLVPGHDLASLHDLAEVLAFRR